MPFQLPHTLKAPRVLKGLMTGVACLASVLSFATPSYAETLQEALISAYTSNPRLMAERARVREFDENYIQARAQGRLTSSISASSGYSVLRRPDTNFLGQPTGTSSTTATEPGSLQLQVIQPLYQGGRIRALKEQAKAGILAAREGLRNTEQTLLFNAATAYSDVRRDEETARIRRNNVRVLIRQLTAATDRFEVGEGTRTDIAQAQTRLAAAEIGLAQADAQLQISRASYVRVVGHPPEDLQPLPSFVLPGSLEQAVKIARGNNPQLLAAILNEDAAEAAIDVAKSASKPTLSINGTAQTVRRQVSGIQKADTGSITAQLSIPIFAGGLNKSRVRAAKHARTRFMFETRDTERALDQAVAQIWAQLDAAQRSLVASRQQVEAAEFAFEGVVLEQQVGTRSTLDVLNAEQELLNARLSVINADAALESAEFQLLTTLGAFDVDALQLPVESYDPKLNFETVKYEGLTETIDTYVPIAVQKIGAQVPNIPNDVIGFAEDGLEEIGVTSVTKKIGKQLPNIPHDIGVLAKKSVDKATRQTEDDGPIVKPAPAPED